MLPCITYPAGRSAFNPIEHAWSPLSNALTGVTLPAILPGKDKPPNERTYLYNKEWQLKEAQVLNTAADKLAKYYNSISFDSNAVVPITIPSLGGKLIYKDHTEIKTFMNAPLRDLKAIPHLMKMKQEFSFFADCIDRHHNEISFLKYQLFKNNHICQHCTENPTKTCDAFQYESSLGGFLFDPVKSEKHPGHYKTYLESFRDCDKYTRDNDTKHR